jgi:hypothetical protein
MQPVAGDVQVIVYLASDDAVVTHTFIAENVALP